MQCEWFALMWRGGSVIVPLKSNTMLLRGSLKFEVAGHRPTEKHQAPESFVGEPPNPLEGFSESVECKASIKLLNEEEIKANSGL